VCYKCSLAAHTQALRGFHQLESCLLLYAKHSTQYNPNPLRSSGIGLWRIIVQYNPNTPSTLTIQNPNNFKHPTCAFPSSVCSYCSCPAGPALAWCFSTASNTQIHSSTQPNPNNPPPQTIEPETLQKPASCLPLLSPILPVAAAAGPLVLRWLGA
jgi:hypothetical protein